MKTLLLLLYALLYYTYPFAQNTTSIIVKAGSNIRDVLSTADVFQYPQFAKGKVFFKDGSSAEAKMNYNRLVDEMHFIDPKRDTLALANEKLIKWIAINQDTFYYDQGYVRLISSTDVAKLAVKQVWIMGDTRKIGAYNTANSTSSITSYSSYSAGSRIYNLFVNEEVVLRKVEHYYFGDRYNHFVLAGKKNLLMLFPKEQRRIEVYLKENKIDFSNKDDLEKAVQFLDHL